jgi:hypothetical protein
VSSSSRRVKNHVALSVNIWAPTGKYDPNNIANVSLNTWTFIPTVAYTKLVPSIDMEFDATAGVEFYTRYSATDYQNPPVFTLDVMALKRFANSLGVGLIVGTVQQPGDDSGPTADKLSGFRGYDWGVAPIVTYDTKLGGKTPVSASLRWVPTVGSKNRLPSTNTFMATATIAFGHRFAGVTQTHFADSTFVCISTVSASILSLSCRVISVSSVFCCNSAAICAVCSAMCNCRSSADFAISSR